MKYIRTAAIGILTITSVLFSGEVSAQAFNVDPALTAAVKLAGDKEKESLNGIKNEQSKINKLQAAVSAQLARIETIQKKSYDYLSNISAGVENAYDIKKSLELTKSITDMCFELKRAVVANPQGLITTAIATKYISDVSKEVASTYAYISTISLNKKALLNSVERLQVTWNVRSKLGSIYQRMYTLLYYVQTYKFKDLGNLLLPNAYSGVEARMSIARSIIRNFKQK